MGTCGSTLPLGEPCTGGTECESTICADRVCCNQDCSGPGLACNLTGQVGSCAVVASPAPVASAWGILGLVASLVLVAFFAIRRYVF